jgi:hypothetical protein
MQGCQTDQVASLRTKDGPSIAFPAPGARRFPVANAPFGPQQNPFIREIEEESRRVKNETQGIAQNGQAEEDAAK